MVRSVSALGQRRRRPRRLPANEPCGIAALLAAGEAGIADAALLARPSGPRSARRARFLAIYLAHVGLGVPLTAVARRFRCHRSSAAYACRSIEERRESAGVDARIAELERAARDAAEKEARHDS